MDDVQRGRGRPKKVDVQDGKINNKGADDSQDPSKGGAPEPLKGGAAEGGSTSGSC